MTLAHKTLNLFLVNALADFCCRLLYSGSDLIASNMHVSRTFLNIRVVLENKDKVALHAATVGICGLLSYEDQSSGHLIHSSTCSDAYKKHNINNQHQPTPVYT